MKLVYNNTFYCHEDFTHHVLGQRGEEKVRLVSLSLRSSTLTLMGFLLPYTHPINHLIPLEDLFVGSVTINDYRRIYNE